MKTDLSLSYVALKPEIFGVGGKIIYCSNSILAMDDLGPKTFSNFQWLKKNIETHLVAGGLYDGRFSKNGLKMIKSFLQFFVQKNHFVVKSIPYVYLSTSSHFGFMYDIEVH